MQEGSVRPGHLAVAHDLRQPSNAQRLCLGLGHHDDGSATVGNLAGVSGGDVPCLVERRTELAEAFCGGVAPDALVLRNRDGVSLALGDLHRNDLVVEEAVLVGGCGPLMRSGGEGILDVAGEIFLGAVGLGAGSHGDVIELVPEAVVHH